MSRLTSEVDRRSLLGQMMPSLSLEDLERDIYIYIYIYSSTTSTIDLDPQVNLY